MSMVHIPLFLGKKVISLSMFRVSWNSSCWRPTPSLRHSATPRPWRTTTAPGSASSSGSTLMPAATSPALILVRFIYILSVWISVCLYFTLYVSVCVCISLSLTLSVSFPLSHSLCLTLSLSPSSWTEVAPNVEQSAFYWPIPRRKDPSPRFVLCTKNMFRWPWGARWDWR